LNTKKVLEIHNALKLLNGNIGKVSSDSKDRYEMLSNEQKLLEQSVSSQLADLRFKVGSEGNSLEERISLAVERVNEKLRSQIEGAALE